VTTRRSALSFDTALGHDAADKRIEILRLVGSTGSISQAAGEAGVSYKAAWQAIDTLTNLAGVTLVERAVGGSGGGGASLTAAGEKLLSIAQLVDEARSQVFAALGDSQGAVPALSGMGLRTSMRNQLPCVVSKLEIKGQVVRVYLQLPNRALLVSRITRVSAELLNLKKGSPVLALCKATAVTVEAVAMPEPGSRRGLKPAAPAAQQLGGRVIRIARGLAGDEVSLELDAGPQLVGFAPPQSGLKLNTTVRALVEEAAVVIALSP
jgi:molybdate transport system regulatory protein